jgi:BMFP domain-containing protein YqiC
VAALREEIDALRYVLARLVDEVDDLDTLARHVPRVSSVAIQAARAMQQLGEGSQEGIREVLGPILTNLDEVTSSRRSQPPSEAVSS